MEYDEIVQVSEKLNYRDKLRLAQLLIQLARKEEEIQNPQKRVRDNAKTSIIAQDQTNNNNTAAYVAERIIKLKPGKRNSLVNSVKSMFQFQGGISLSLTRTTKSLFYNQSHTGKFLRTSDSHSS